MQIRPREILHYTTPSGRNPYRQWYTRKGVITMNIDIKLQQCTSPFKDYLLKDLAQPEFAKGYLEVALQDFDKDGNIETLLLCMKDVAEAQGGIDRLVNWTDLSPQDLTYLLNAKSSLQLDKVLDILSKLKGSPLKTS